MNVFLNSEIAKRYDEYYVTEQGQKIDHIEKQIISGFLKIFQRGSCWIWVVVQAIGLNIL